MPVDLEIYLSQTGTSLFGYPAFGENPFSFENRYDNDGSYSFPRSHILVPKDSQRAPCSEKKTTLDSYTFDTASKGTKKTIADVNKRKKVSFADDKGFRLVEIREIPGLSLLPNIPKIPVTNECSQELAIQKYWKIASENPPWTDSKLIEMLEKNKVVLESATIKTKTGNFLDETLEADSFHSALQSSKLSNEYVLQGVIKVKNVSYEKKVFARITFDRWLTSIDVEATYLRPEKKPERHYEYDNFVFSIVIPPSAFKYEVIEFCIGYICNNKKYWDNNGGINYRLITEVIKNKTEQPKRHPNKKSNDKITLCLTENFERFSEIDSWSNFINNQPYW